MGKTIMGAVVSLNGFMADDNDGVGRCSTGLTPLIGTPTRLGASRQTADY